MAMKRLKGHIANFSTPTLTMLKERGYIKWDEECGLYQITEEGEQWFRSFLSPTLVED